MKFSVNVETDLLRAIDERAAAASITRTAWVQAELSKAVNPGESTENPALIEAETERDRLTALVAERDRTIAELTAERDRIVADLRTAKDQAASTAIELAELRTRTADDRETIRRLEGDIHWSRMKIDELTPRLLAENVENGRHWWQFWKRKQQG